MKVTPIIGIEVHVQLSTQTKLFCGCRTSFGDDPNTHTCPVCLGHPGVLPVLNAHALELAIKSGLSFDATIAPRTKFDRKNYFYPDLPKAYQISQFDEPINGGGGILIDLPDGTQKTIRLIRAHLEEDAGKLMHLDGTSNSLVDLNRAGTPLLEIVSEPDLASAEEAYLYLTELKLLLKYLEVSDCEMQEGSLRCDVNINIKIDDDGKEIRTPIVEVKNLNSFRGAQGAIEFEVRHQEKRYKEEGESFLGEGKVTKGWNAEKERTYVQRSKEEAMDYRYFQDPDLPPFEVTSDYVEKIRSGLPELPRAKRDRYQSDLGLSAYDASVIVSAGKPIAQYFEEALAVTGDAKTTANWLINDILFYVNENKKDIAQINTSAKRLGDLIKAVKDNVVSRQRAKDVFAVIEEEDKDVAAIIEERNWGQVSDTGELEGAVRTAIEANPNIMEDIRNGKDAAKNFFVGQVMKASKGKANPGVVKQLIDKIVPEYL